MHILKNKKYYVVIPQCNQAARTCITYLLKTLYKKELHHAKMSIMTVSQKDIDTAGMLKERSI